MYVHYSEVRFNIEMANLFRVLPWNAYDLGRYHAAAIGWLKRGSLRPSSVFQLRPLKVNYG
jgi:hypothetical protein